MRTRTVVIVRIVSIVSIISLAAGCRGEPLDHSLDLALGSAFEDGPPDAPKPPLTGCDAKGTAASDVILGLRMAAAAACVGLNAPRMNGYGCFCGEGNTGVDTRPADALDACCQRHDLDWHAICQNTPVTPGSTQGCNCYTNTPALTCTNGVLSVPAGLNPCQRACGEELVKNTTCMDDNQGIRNDDYWQGRPLDRTPFDGPCPSYCRKGNAPPKSDFGPIQLPPSQNYPTCDPAPEDNPPDPEDGAPDQP